MRFHRLRLWGALCWRSINLSRLTVLRFLLPTSSCSAFLCGEFLAVPLHLVQFCGSITLSLLSFGKLLMRRDGARVVQRDVGQSTGEGCPCTHPHEHTGTQLQRGLRPQKGSAPFSDPGEQSQMLTQQHDGGGWESPCHPV